MKSISNQTIVVIGGTGHLGGAAVTALHKHNAKVTILSRTPGLSSDGIDIVEGDITNLTTLAEPLSAVDGVVIAVDAPHSPEKLHEVYVDGVANVLKSVSPDTHITFMSHAGITDIDSNPEYDKAKLESEKLIRASGLPYTIIRPAWIISGSNTGVAFEQGDNYTGRRDDLTPENLGEAIVASFEFPEANGKTFELYGGSNNSPQWQNEFSKLTKDLL